MSDPLAGLARRAEDRPEFLAALLAAFARSEDMNDDALAAYLRCSPGQLSRLKLCRTPADEPAALRQDVARLAVLFGVDGKALRFAVKRGRVIVRLRRSGEAILLAARDRE